MANTRDIRVKIATTKKTQQTTKAMKVVSAAKLRKAQDRITQARPYAIKMAAVIKRLAQSAEQKHPLLGEPPTSGKLLLVVLTSDKGLCGAFNSSITKYAKTFWTENKSKYEKIDFIFIGRKAADTFKRMNVAGIETITNLAAEVSYELAAGVSTKLLDYYKKGEYSEVRIIYNEFKSALSQKVTDETFLPIKAEALEGKDGVETTDFIFEPSAAEILGTLLEKHFAIQVYRAMQESLASEHGARMNSMENATRNAGELIKNLTLYYNKVRQAAITTELTEIVSGAEAINN